MPKAVVHCSLPKAGLGNQLFPLLKAHLFAEKHQLPIVITGYNRLKIGPYLRGDKSKRNYQRSFSFQKNWLAALMAGRSIGNFQHTVHETQLSEAVVIQPNTRYLFDSIPHWSDPFDGLKQHRDQVLKIFQALLHPSVKEALNNRPYPIVGVHIRMGDFRKLQSNEDFAKVGGVRTPETYFIEMINGIRKMAGRELPVIIFTDGHQHELPALFQLPGITLAEGNRDIVDLILLSKSKIIVASAGSTFSTWAGFLSAAALILHPDHIHASVRPAAFNEKFYEGALRPSATEALLQQNITELI
jgi:Glycosyl transferase family 11